MAVFPLPAVHVQSGEGNAADGRHQQEPDEDLTEDGILHHLRLSLKQQYSYCLSPHTHSPRICFIDHVCVHTGSLTTFYIALDERGKKPALRVEGPKLFKTKQK